MGKKRGQVFELNREGSAWNGREEVSVAVSGWEPNGVFDDISDRDLRGVGMETW